MNSTLVGPISMREAREGIGAGETELRVYVDGILDRVEEIEPRIRGLVPEEKRRERLASEVEELERRFADARERPPLYGTLLGVKDIFRAEGLQTRAGSLLPPEIFAGAEAECVSALRRAGMLCLGKTVTTEMAYFEPGPTRNPHDLGHTPGGSSSGSAAAVAAGYCHLALGTQTVGSVIRPAAFCGVVGFKPSVGRISTAGLIYFSPTVDTVGLFAAEVEGVGLGAEIVCRDWREIDAVERPVLGIPEGRYLEQASAEGLKSFAEQALLLERGGYRIERVPMMADIEEINRRHRRLIAGEVARVHEGWFDEYETLYRQRTAEIIREGKRIGEEEIERARTGCLDLREELGRRMRENGVDLWICPAAPGTAPAGIQTTGDPIMNLPWSHAGLPAMSLPAGKGGNGLPLGLQCVADFGRDESLLAWGWQLERDLRG